MGELVAKPLAARIISLAQASGLLDSSYGFSRGKATLTGLDNNTCELLLQVPQEASGGCQLVPLVGLLIANATGGGGVTALASHPPSPATTSSSGVTNHSFSDPDSALSSRADAAMSRHSHSPGGHSPAGRDVISISTPAFQIDWKLSRALTILFLTALAANFVSQIARINELTTRLQQTQTTLLEELESANHLHLTIVARPQESRGEEAVWLSVAGGLGSRDLAAVFVLSVEDTGRGLHGQELAVADSGARKVMVVAAQAELREEDEEEASTAPRGKP